MTKCFKYKTKKNKFKFKSLEINSRLIACTRAHVYVTYLLDDRCFDIVSCTINSRILSEVEHGNKIQIVSQLSKVSTFFLLLKPDAVM